MMVTSVAREMMRGRTEAGLLKLLLSVFGGTTELSISVVTERDADITVVYSLKFSN